MAEKVYYSFKGMLSQTKCPYNKGIKVCTYSCLTCEYRGGRNEQESYILCTYAEKNKKERIMNKLHYDMSARLCITKCPYQDNKKIGQTYTCQECDYFQSIDTDQQIVTCSYPNVEEKPKQVIDLTVTQIVDPPVEVYVSDTSSFNSDSNFTLLYSIDYRRKYPFSCKSGRWTYCKLKSQVVNEYMSKEEIQKFMDSPFKFMRIIKTDGTDDTYGSIENFELCYGFNRYEWIEIDQRTLKPIGEPKKFLRKYL